MAPREETPGKEISAFYAPAQQIVAKVDEFKGVQADVYARHEQLKRAIAQTSEVLTGSRGPRRRKRNSKRTGMLACWCSVPQITAIILTDERAGAESWSSAARPDLFEALATGFDLGEDAIHTRSPSVGDRFVIPRGEELIDGLLEFLDTAEGATPDRLLLQFGKPALDEIEPTGAGRDEMKHETWTLAQPGADACVAIDGIVVENQVQAARGWKLTLQPAKQAQELLIAVPRVMLGDDSALADMERSKQTGGAVSFILVGEGPAATRLQRQSRLRPIQRLNLALLVYTQHHPVLRRLKITASPSWSADRIASRVDVPKRASEAAIART